MMQENEPRKRGGIPIEKTRLTFCKKCGLRTRHEWHQWNHRSLLSLILGRINVIDGWGRTKCGLRSAIDTRFLPEGEEASDQ